MRPRVWLGADTASLLGMLVVPATRRRSTRGRLGAEFRRARVPRRLIIDRSDPVMEWDSWCAYGKPCREFLDTDRSLARCLRQLRKAWFALLESPRCASRRRNYCWRYFCLLRSALQLACDERNRVAFLGVLQRIVAFETFTVEVRGRTGIAAGLLGGRHPAFLLGRLPAGRALPTPRHVALALPLGQNQPFYCYRQIRLSDDLETTMLVLPTAELKHRRSSFIPIDRLAQILGKQGDPRWKPRARVLAQRVLLPLLRKALRVNRFPTRRNRVTILDLGAGTGHLTAAAWRELRQSAASARSLSAVFHFVDAAGPCYGRSFGLSRLTGGMVHIEWTKAEYRRLLDDDQWLMSNGPFDWVFMCRLLGNESNILIEDAREFAAKGSDTRSDDDPCVCLAPGRQPQGLRRLRVSTVRRTVRAGTFMPQYSLCDYYAAMRAVMAGNIHAVDPAGRYLPVRRFNPAALTTLAGRSILTQLIKVASAIVIEDVDLLPEQLVAHREQFGLEDTAAVQFVRDGFATQARHYLIARPAIAGRLQGKRLW